VIRAYLRQLDPIPRFLNADELARGLSLLGKGTDPQWLRTRHNHPRTLGDHHPADNHLGYPASKAGTLSVIVSQFLSRPGQGL